MDRQRVYRQVAELHVANIDQGFLATLGVPFLALMYRAMDEAPDSVLLTEEREGRVVGFISGGAGMGQIYRRMLRRPLALAVALMPSLIRPARVSRIMDILRYGRDENAHSGLPGAELFSIAIAPGARGQGVAQGLYERLVQYFRKQGIAAFKIAVGDALEPAHRFYARMGAIPSARVEVHPGCGSVIYVQGVVADPMAAEAAHPDA